MNTPEMNESRTALKPPTAMPARSSVGGHSLDRTTRCVADFRDFQAGRAISRVPINRKDETPSDFSKTGV
jgi:hypothetical protein